MEKTEQDVCNRCDGAHASSQCPHFKEKRTITQEELDAAALKLGITLPPKEEPLYINKSIYSKRYTFYRDDKHASRGAVPESYTGCIAQCNLLNQFHPRYLGKLKLYYVSTPQLISQCNLSLIHSHGY